MKKIKQIIIVLLCIILLNGCVKENITMTINKDKSMNYEALILFSDKMMESSTNESNSLSEQIKEIEKNGFKVTPKTENGYSGYSITKTYKNIDDLSNNNGEEVNIDDFFEKDKISNAFKVKKGFFKNTYTATFVFETDESSLNSGNESLLDDEDTTTNDETTINDETTTNEDNLSVNTDQIVPTTQAIATNENSEVDDNLGALMNLAKEMEFKYVVKLPYGSSNNNASDVSKDKKTLTWTLSSEGLNNINYSFPIYNLTNIIIVGAVALLVLIIIIVIIVIKSKKNKGEKETLIHTDYDVSIVGQIDETTSVVDEIPAGPANHEFSVPDSSQANEIPVGSVNQDFSVPTPPQVDVTNEVEPQTPTISSSTQVQMQYSSPQPMVEPSPQATILPQENITQGPSVNQTANSIVQLDIPNMIEFSQTDQNNINQ